MSEWGPWLKEGRPGVGEYVQISMWNEEAGQRVEEGFIGGNSGEFSWFTHDTIVNSGGWKAIEWRRRKSLGFRLLESILLEVETRRPLAPDL